MTIYAVEQQHMNDGEVRIRTHTLEADSLPPSSVEECATYDLYMDYFDDAKKATQFIKERYHA